MATCRPGVHDATGDEIARRSGGTSRRTELLAGLRRALVALKEAGRRTVYLDGRFATPKDEPVDFDACSGPAGVNYRRIDSVLYDLERGWWSASGP